MVGNIKALARDVGLANGKDAAATHISVRHDGGEQASILQSAGAGRLRRTLCGHSWFGHPQREHPGHPEKKEIEGQEDDQARV